VFVSCLLPKQHAAQNFKSPPIKEEAARCALKYRFLRVSTIAVKISCTELLYGRFCFFTIKLDETGSSKKAGWLEIFILQSALEFNEVVG